MGSKKAHHAQPSHLVGSLLGRCMAQPRVCGWLMVALLRIPLPTGLSQHASLQEERGLTPSTQFQPGCLREAGSAACPLGKPAPLDFQCYFWSLVIPGKSRMGRQHTRQNFGFPYLLPSHASETPLPRACRENPTSYFDEMRAPERLRLNSKSLLLI